MIDYAALADGYDRLRPAGQGWQEVSEATFGLLGGTTRLLDVGCGTGRFAVLAAERLGAKVWGVDPSEDMLARARARPGSARVGWKRAGAERLPFKDGWFDGAHMHLVAHVLADPGSAYAELARVLAAGGRLVIATFRPEHFAGFYLNPYFPSIPRIDGERFPDPSRLAADLAAAGFAELAAHPIDQPVAPDPDELLERVRGRYISTLHLLDDEEYREGVARIERALARGERPAGMLRWAVVEGRRT